MPVRRIDIHLALESGIPLSEGAAISMFTFGDFQDCF